MPDILSRAPTEVAWTQRYFVATCCRVLYSLVTGEVTSKRMALHWAAERPRPEVAAVAGSLTPLRPLLDLELNRGGDASTLPAASVARTETSYLPTPRCLNFLGDVHGWNVDSSMVRTCLPVIRHSNRAPGSSEVNANFAVDFVVRFGPAVNLLTGAVLSVTARR